MNIHRINHNRINRKNSPQILLRQQPLMITYLNVNYIF
ncbi:hypothetical protein BLA29_013819 [Euroglyphus maynei]|uniref:Uncharacterized protein n=1 Tax=Euroglyphus maynei TaxID=6958 RepID=A0A1Y3BSV8_EURMA|nr:hypothetical protein BLA29_013819 [Euroglyphus maynei]